MRRHESKLFEFGVGTGEFGRLMGQAVLGQLAFRDVLEHDHGADGPVIFADGGADIFLGGEGGVVLAEQGLVGQVVPFFVPAQVAFTAGGTGPGGKKKICSSVLPINSSIFQPVMRAAAGLTKVVLPWRSKPQRPSPAELRMSSLRRCNLCNSWVRAWTCSSSTSLERSNCWVCWASERSSPLSLIQFLLQLLKVPRHGGVGLREADQAFFQLHPRLVRFVGEDGFVGRQRFAGAGFAGPLPR